MEKPFAHAERFELDEEDGSGRHTFLVLAISEIGGKEYALLAREDEIVASVDDMSVYVFGYVRGDDGTSLAAIDDDETASNVYRHFAELLEFEESDGDES